MLLVNLVNVLLVASSCITIVVYGQQQQQQLPQQQIQPTLSNPQQPQQQQSQSDGQQLSIFQSKVQQLEKRWTDEHKSFLSKQICSPNSTINSQILNNFMSCSRPKLGPQQNKTTNLLKLEAKELEIKTECSIGLDSRLVNYNHVNLSDPVSKFIMLSYCVGHVYQQCVDEKMMAFLNNNKQLVMELDIEKHEGKHGVLPKKFKDLECEKLSLGLTDWPDYQGKLVKEQEYLYNNIIQQQLCNSPDNVNTNIINALRNCKPEMIIQPQHPPNWKLQIEKLNQLTDDCLYDDESQSQLTKYNQSIVDLQTDKNVAKQLLLYCSQTYEYCHHSKIIENIESNEKLTKDYKNEIKNGLINTTKYNDLRDCVMKVFGIKFKTITFY
ncbi:uncharacterized protein LOC128959069 [Oppia nitens]|uniref:uncharacterized protein LOC128959069 n=1 Tax=Oppia nitens TaxID=1686743 RepID=UPI0023DA6F28|nr:uncharacterized protein LOC128959069 [Oppia nitens]